ncbi:MAG: glycosyltransferase family 4 protein [Planctomycetes bacterium]|nr:glycosyltransferase family 4 protein [Planctomycetota bacterium]
MTAPHLLHVFSTFVPAGPETRTVNLIEALGKEYRHTILAIDGRTDAAKLFTGRAEVRVLEAPPRAGSFTTLRRLRALFQAEKPDLTLSYNWGAFDAVFAARTLKQPHVHHEDGFTSDEAVEFKKRRVWTRRLFLPTVARVVVPSKKLERIARDLWKLDDARVQYVPNGIRLDKFGVRDGRPKLRERLGIPKDALVAGYVGHLRPEKNPLRFLKACARVDRELPLRVLVLGDGPERAACEAFASATPALYDRVHFAGHVADPADHYRAMDAFVISSDTEQMPVALLEAMASALPVVSTDVGDVRSMLSPEQDAFVVPVEERESAWPLAEELTALLQDAALRERLGAANRARVKTEFSFERMLAAYRDVYRAALAPR